MAQIVEIDALITGRPSETALAELRRRLTPDGDLLEWTFEETVGLSHMVMAKNAPTPVALPMGTIAKGRLVLVLAEEPVRVYINGASTDPLFGRFLLYEADETTGITAVHVQNISSTTDILIEYFIGGDIA